MSMRASGSTAWRVRRSSGRSASGCAAQSVVLATGTQLATTLALLELDGLARRIVLCPPDLGPQHLPGVMATAGARIVVSDRPMPDLQVPAPTCIAPARLRRAAAHDRGGAAVSEWALFTSGTTGPPKMAIHSLRSLTGAIARTTNAAGDQVWSTFYDIRRYGGLQILLRALLGGGSMVLSGADEPVERFPRARGARPASPSSPARRRIGGAR